MTKFGSWPSPITATSLVAGAVGINEVVLDGGDIWWGESRPDEGGRTALMRWSDGQTTEMTAPQANVRTRVHEYGGGAWWVQNGVCFYVDYADQRLRRLDGGGVLFLTPEPEVRASLRYADGRVTPDGKWFVCVHETHEAGGEVRNEIVAVAVDGSETMHVLASGVDFYASPRISSDGTQVAWIQWSHPNMPWDVTELWIADLVDGEARNSHQLVGNGDEALQEPQWSDDGSLRVVTDRNEWWNIFIVDIATGELALDVGGDFEVVTPHWVFGLSHYGEGVHVEATSSGQVLRVEGNGDPIALPYTVLSSVRRNGDILVCLAGSAASETEVIRIDLSQNVPHPHVIRAARDLKLSEAFLPNPEAITFPTKRTPSDNPNTDPVAHALFYAPANPDHQAHRSERPPLVVLIHGGPTAAARRQLQLGHRYWTSRGIAVVDVDYRGSTGYGRTYRHSLDDQWGVADVADAVAAAHYLADRGDVDSDRLIIRGGSAGGFTTLAALAFDDVFAVGGSRYGVADLSALAEDTHKFEARYLDRLVGPYPEAAAVYAERSPINHIDKFNVPMIVLQGDEDEVVPPNQSEMIVDALRSKNIKVQYLLFEGEQHGFRQAGNIVAALEAELKFYGDVLGFEPSL